ncbi:unnamed protein product [Caenorhabditis auriculariae]|uniref:PRKCA-binding protein n=1 Tax=Caenorhabditis auriculariae TaxID=2777116 RepID=A0A8S1HH99_9PELO|nr:unnamed protein product [Caenorhabditis auriculariae]
MGLRVQAETLEIVKDEKGLVGISIGGGSPYCPCVYVVQIFDGSPASKDGRIRAGDEVVAVNGISVKGERKSAVAQLIQVSLNPVKITINKLESDASKGKTLDIVLKKIVEFMDQDSADALGLSRAILCNDPLAAKMKILESNAEFYCNLVSYFGDSFHYLDKIAAHQKEFGDIFCDLAAHEKQATANEAFTAFGERHRLLERKQSDALKRLRPIVADLQVYVDHVVPDTQLTIKKYLDVKYEYLSYCLKLKEMDDEEAEFLAIQENLYRIETGNYEYRLMLRCRHECRQRFLQMRSDVMVKIELLDQKHVRDITQHLTTFAKSMAKCQSDCAEVLKDPIDVPIEIDLAQLSLQNQSEEIPSGSAVVDWAEEALVDLDSSPTDLIDVGEESVKVSIPKDDSGLEDSLEPLLSANSNDFEANEFSLIDIG